MKKDRFNIYILEILFLVIILLALLLPNIFNRIVFAILLVGFTFLLNHFIKKKNQVSIHKNEIIVLMIVFAIIYLIGFYLMGLYFGFYRSPVKFSIWSIINYIIPIIVIIISSEKIRDMILTVDSKIVNIGFTIGLILIDFIIYSNMYDLNDFNGFMSMLGYVLFASISCNCLYNYVSKRYGNIGVILYRLATVLYSYIIPIIPDVYFFFRSFLRLIYPYFIYLIIEYAFSKKSAAIVYKDKNKNAVIIVIYLVIAVLFIMLISCQFKYGVLVIGTGSMTGSLNIGDVIIYESYDGELIEEKDIIIFDKDDKRVVHRVIDIENRNGETRYITKGDANTTIDPGYVVSSNVVGKVGFSIPYIGYPTIWLRDMFSE